MKPSLQSALAGVGGGGRQADGGRGECDGELGAHGARLHAAAARRYGP
jgi:hypothetical protein